ncbi:hypothetical protein BJ978_002539 [Agromyces terreus]|uniref:Uncharacterized protein n=1 Tax=Agromyces terreus TaxID=424795 RepID=A0A9X2H2Q1_9MICO|nr:hypothetical protein [Agromyces terreus]MCP2371863.1 hypothetical protein [Agromyces terreus]
MTASSAPHRRRPVFTIVAAAAAAAATAVLLSGCFFIPLADNRSPFDDPFGPSFDDVRSHHAELQAALDEAVPAEWKTTVSTASDNCEGACNLRLGVSIDPTAALGQEVFDAGDAAAQAEWEEGERIRVPLPADVLATIVRTAAPIAADAHLSFDLEPGWSEEPVPNPAGVELFAVTDMAAAVAEVTGLTEDYSGDDQFRLANGTLSVATSSGSADAVLARLP